MRNNHRMSTYPRRHTPRKYGRRVAPASDADDNGTEKLQPKFDYLPIAICATPEACGEERQRTRCVSAIITTPLAIDNDCDGDVRHQKHQT